MSRRNNPEEQLQRAVVEWLRWMKPNCVWFFVNNGARLSKAQAGKAIGMGVLPGVADLVFVLPGGRVGFIELKAPGPHLSLALPRGLPACRGDARLERRGARQGPGPCGTGLSPSLQPFYEEHNHE